MRGNVRVIMMLDKGEGNGIMMKLDDKVDADEG